MMARKIEIGNMTIHGSEEQVENIMKKALERIAAENREETLPKDNVHEINVDTTKAVKNVQALDAAMKVLSRTTNDVPRSRLEWLAIAHIGTQTFIGLALLAIAFAIVRGR